MLAGNVGSPWTLEEENEETVNGLAVAEIAAAHGRTTGGIRARQQQMGLRDEAGELTSPPPEFRSALRGENGGPPRAKRRRRSKRPVSSVLRAASSGSRETSQVGLDAPVAWPEDFPHDGDWVEKLWRALRHDAEALLRKDGQVETRNERALNITLSRLTPDDDLHPWATMAALGEAYGVTRERIRQIEIKTLHLLTSRIQQTNSLTRRLLDEMADAAPGNVEASPSWFALEFARQDCRTAFMGCRARDSPTAH